MRGFTRSSFVPPVVVALVVTVRATFGAAGDLDPAFGIDGYVTTLVREGDTHSEAVVVQPDGRIVIAGYSLSAEDRVFLVRYLPNGTLDGTFGVGGIVESDELGTAEAFALALDGSGRILVAGAGDLVSSTGESNFLVARYAPDGTLDPTFGTAGWVTTPVVGTSRTLAYGILVQPDGRIVAAGWADQQPVIARWEADGDVDASFGIGGQVRTELAGGYGVLRAVALQADGKILAAGSRLNFSGPSDGILLRYDSDGTLDTTFDGDGIATVPNVWILTGATTLADGRILVAGSGDLDGSPPFYLHIVFARFTSTGGLDGTFGSGGVVDVGGELSGSVMLQPDGRAVASGRTVSHLAAARVDADGVPDATFGDGGIATMLPSRLGLFGQIQPGTMTPLALQPDGGIIVVGAWYSGAAGEPPTHAVVARFLPVDLCANGTLDPTETCDDGNVADGDGCSATCQLEPESASGSVGGAFFEVTTDGESDGATAGDTVETTVTVPGGTTAGFVSISESPVPPQPPGGYILVTTLVQITTSGITPAPTTTDPLRIRFRVDASQLLPGEDEQSLVLTRNGVLVDDCSGPVGSAVPNPCVARALLGDGDVELTVYTTAASDFLILRGLCPPSPTALCASSLPQKSKLLLKEAVGKDVLTFKWKSAIAVSKAELGAPLTGQSYALCLYDSAGLIAAYAAPAAGTCAGKPCWSEKTKTFKYADRERTPDGLSTFALGTGARPGAKMTVKGKGPLLGVPGLPVGLPIAVQVRNTSGRCWGATYATAVLNTAERLKATSD